MCSYSVSVFIPTLNAENHLKRLAPLLVESLSASQIFVIDSSSQDKTISIAKQFGIQTLLIPRYEFNHGRTRNLSTGLCNSDFIVFLTQDACPVSNKFLEYLLKPFENDSLVVATYARQLPRHGSTILEQLDRSVKYPSHDLIQSQQTLSELGSRAYFLSNSCAAYRTSTFLELGGFPDDEIMGEDAIFAQKAISKGYKIVYASQSEVFHSHNYSLVEQFKRYFDTGVYRSKSLNQLDLIESKGDINQGSSYARAILTQLVSNKNYQLIPEFILSLAVGLLGYSTGKKYKLIPNSIRKKLSMHSFFWNK